MKRLLIFPALFAGAVTYAYLTGMAWPIATTFWRLVAPEPCSEGDYMA